MAIADRCECGKVQLDNPKSMKENPFFMDQKTGQTYCKACYSKKFNLQARITNWFFTKWTRLEIKIESKLRKIKNFRVKTIYS